MSSANIKETKIMCYLTSIQRGGAERVLVSLANELAERGYNVYFAISFKTREDYFVSDAIQLVNLNIKNNWMNSFILRNVYRVVKLRGLIKTEKPDIIISFLPEPNFCSIVASLGLPIKNIISIRSDPSREYKNWLYAYLARKLYVKAEACIFQTEEAKNKFNKCKLKNSVVIPNPISEKFFKQIYKGNRKNIVAVGSLRHVKNYELLLEAFKIILKDFPDEQLLIYGDGPQKQELLMKIQNLNIKDKVILCGVSQEIHNDIYTAELYVLSSNQEGLPNSLMEAMALGLPCISTDCPCGGPRFLIEEGKNGLLVSINDKQAMACAIRKVISDQDFALQLGENAQNSMKSFKIGKIVDLWVQVINTALLY